MTSDGEPPRSDATAHKGRTLLLIALLAVGVRLLFLAQMGADPRFDRPYADQLIYHHWASAWGVHGQEYAHEPVGQPFWRSPGYPLFLSLVYRFAGDDLVTGPRTAAAIQMALGALATLAVCAFVLRRWGRAAAWLSAILCTLHAPLVFCESLLLPVGLSTPLLTFTGLCVLRILEQGKPDRRRALVGGLLAGLNAVVRPNFGLVIPIAGWLLWRKRATRPAAWVLVAAAALPLAATTGWNLARSGELVVTGANGPLNLYFAYGRYAGPTFDARDEAWNDPEAQAEVAQRIVAQQTGRAVEEVGRKEASRFFARRALAWMAENPWQVPLLAAEKVLGVLTWRDLAVIAPVDASRSSIRILELLIVPFPLLLFAALYAAWRLRGEAAAAVWIGFVPILVSAVLYFTYTRFRVPMVPLLALAAGPGLLALTRSLRGLSGHSADPEHARGPAFADLGFLAVVAALVWLSWVPWLRAEPRADRYWATPISKGWHQVGIGWVMRYGQAGERGEAGPVLLDKAIAAFERAQELQPSSPANIEWIARVERDLRGNGREAWRMLDEALPDYPPRVYTGIAAELALCEVQGLGPSGRPDFRRAVELFGQVEARHLLHMRYWEAYAEALLAVGRTQDACELMRRLATSPQLSEPQHEAARAKLRTWGCPE